MAPPTDARFARAVAAFDAAHARDPRGRAAAYHAALARWVDAHVPDAPEPMRLAARAQHLERWAVPRESFGAGVLEYKKWRATAARHTSTRATELLAEAGYEPAVCERVADFVLKRGLRGDPEVAAFEDAICLTFLELDALEFARRPVGETGEPRSADEIGSILDKTLAKMTERGRAVAVRADALPAPIVELVRARVEALTEK
ncbi:MAG: DUF4202 family protein [Polyangiaceae bacterium]